MHVIDWYSMLNENESNIKIPITYKKKKNLKMCIIFKTTYGLGIWKPKSK